MVLDQQNADIAINIFFDRLKQYSHKIDQVYIFGSYARGEMHEESDIDILIVTYGDWFELQNEIIDFSVPLNIEYNVFLSIKVVEVDQFKKMKQQQSQFYQNLIKEGELVDF